MVGVDPHQRSVETDRTFVKRDQCAKVEGIHLWNAERDRFAAILIKSRASPAQKPLEVITARYARFYFNPIGRPVFPHFNEGGEEIWDAVAQLLNVSVLIG